MEKNALSCLLILSFICGVSFAAPESVEAEFDYETGIWETEFDLSSGYRQDDFDWNIAGDIDGQNPNILSELKWRDLRIVQINANSKFIYDKKFRLECLLGYGRIYNGDNQDSDYSGDDRTLEFSRSNNKTEGNNISNWSIGVGYQFNLDKVAENLAFENIIFTLLEGYSQYNQYLTITDGYQTIPDTGAFDGLHSTYDTVWKGPWLGAELEGTKGKIIGFARFEYHWADYDADADWNLRGDFAHPVSFSHKANGKGNILTLGAGYNLNNNCALYLKTNIQRWETEDGLDRTFFSDNTSTTTRLNGVNWKSTAILIGIKFRI